MNHLAFGAIHRLIDRLAVLPGIRQARRALFARKFRRRMGHAFHGVYDSFGAAAAALPRCLPSSYDSDEAARMYVQHTSIDDHDWPAMFWLQDAFANGLRTVADLGGSTGIKFYAFAPLLRLPPDLRWRVIEVPAAVRLGREIAQGLGESRLQFASDVREADGIDILFASGSLQYLPESLGEILAKLATKPRRIVVNTTPIHPQRSFFTQNNIGTACCPYRVTAHDDFVAEVAARGYRLRSEWRNLAKTMSLPYEIGYSVDHYSGFCFDRIATD